MPLATRNPGTAGRHGETCSNVVVRLRRLGIPDTGTGVAIGLAVEMREKPEKAATAIINRDGEPIAACDRCDCTRHAMQKTSNTVGRNPRKRIVSDGGLIAGPCDKRRDCGRDRGIKHVHQIRVSRRETTRAANRELPIPFRLDGELNAGGQTHAGNFRQPKRNRSRSML